MSRLSTSICVVLVLLMLTEAHGTGLVTCDSGPQETWQLQSTLEQMLRDKGWKVNRIKVDGGCYEVYAIDEQGNRVEAYFHPKTLERVPSERP